jgi:O-antigen/teichoic acid export membrane protein
MIDMKKIFYLGIGLGAKLLVGLFVVKLNAELLGPEYFGVTGQLSSLLAVVSLLAGAGLSVGLTKVYAGTEFPIESRPQWIKSAWWVAIISSGILSGLILLSSGWLFENLFSGIGQTSYWLLGALIAGTFPIAFAGIGQGKINGTHRDDLFALSLVSGSVLGLLGVLALVQGFGVTGALMGMIWLIVAQAISMGLFGRLVYSQSSLDTAASIADLISNARFLLSYGALSIAAGTIIPLVYIAIRLVIQQHEGDRIYGLWQATLRISEAYSQLPLMLLSVVLFSRFAASATKPLDKVQVHKTYLFIAGLMFCITAFVYLSRDYWISIVFTSQFEDMGSFVAWQLAGDSLRILSYLGTTVLAARGAIKLCLFGELVQGALLLVTTIFLVPTFPVYGAYYAYIFTYILYLLMTYTILRIREVRS